MKNQKGITLVALVITIVVLIILSGITISLSIGESGIFNKAEQAKGEYINAQIEEEVSINTISEQLMGEEKIVEQIILSANTLTIFKGETAELTVTINPSDATNKNIIWNSTNTNVATVENGIVTAIAPGTTTITVSPQNNNNVTASCEITVKDKLYLIKDGRALVGMSKTNISSITQNEGYSKIITNTVAARAHYYTTNLIDLTNYTKLSADIELTQRTGTSRFLGMLTSSSNKLNTTDFITLFLISGENGPTSKEREVYTADISNKNNKYIISFCKNADPGRVEYKLYNLWLEN